MKKIAVFCGSGQGTNKIYAEAADQLGKFLVTHHWQLVYGGAKVGLMGSSSSARRSLWRNAYTIEK